MIKNTSLELGDYFEEFLKEKVNSGRYGSVSGVIFSALRMLEEEEKKKSHLLTPQKLEDKANL